MQTTTTRLSPVAAALVKGVARLCTALVILAALALVVLDRPSGGPAERNWGAPTPLFEALARTSSPPTVR
jgi:hypothetical protein